MTLLEKIWTTVLILMLIACVPLIWTHGISMTGFMGKWLITMIIINSIFFVLVVSPLNEKL